MIGCDEEPEDKSLWAIGQLEAHAVHYIRSENDEMAVRCLSAALSIVMPASDECRLRLRFGILLYTKFSLFALAIENLQKAVRLAPKPNVELKYKCSLALGKVLEKSGRAQMALNIYEEQLREFLKMPNSWFETFVIAKARLLCICSMHVQAQKLLTDAGEYKKGNALYIPIFRSFLDRNTPNATPLECISRVLEELKEEDYGAVQQPLNFLMKHTGMIRMSEHLVGLNESDFRNVMRLITIVYASIDGKQKLKDLIDGLDKVPEKYSYLKRVLRSLFLSLQQKDEPPFKSEIPQVIQNAVDAYFKNAPYHEIKAYLLESLKEINLKSQNADRKALTLLLLAWLYCESDLELTLTMSQAAGMIGEWRESPLILMLAHGALTRIYAQKGMQEEAAKNHARARAYLQELNLL